MKSIIYNHLNIIKQHYFFDASFGNKNVQYTFMHISIVYIKC